MSKHNRERKRLWKLRLTKKHLGQRLEGSKLVTAIQRRMKNIQADVSDLIRSKN
jgi:hypothetical protein